MVQSSLSQSSQGLSNRPGLWVILIAVLPAVLLCAAIGLHPYIEPDVLFRDPLAVAHDAAAQGQCCHAYYGFVSQLGILVWGGGSFTALFAAMVLFTQGSSRGAWQFMAAAGVLTGLLVIDDVFQGHEVVYPKLFGVPESFVFVIYAALMVGLLWKFRRQIMEVGPNLLIISLIAFSVSVAVDLLVSDEVSWHRLVEDGSKMVGITSWTTYLWWAAWTMITGLSAKTNVS